MARSTINFTAADDAAGEGVAADSATLTATVTITNTAVTAAPAGARVAFTLVEASTGKVVGTSMTAKLPSIPAGGGATATCVPALWF